MSRRAAARTPSALPGGAERREGRARSPVTGFRRGVRLGIDVGKARVGVARCDPDGLLATPVETVPRDDGSIARIVALAAGARRDRAPRRPAAEHARRGHRLDDRREGVRGGAGGRHPVCPSGSSTSASARCPRTRLCAIRADPSVRLVALLTRSRPSSCSSKHSMSRRAPDGPPDHPSPRPRSPPDMPDSTSPFDDPFADLFGKLPDPRSGGARATTLRTATAEPRDARLPAQPAPVQCRCPGVRLARRRLVRRRPSSTRWGLGGARGCDRGSNVGSSRAGGRRGPGTCRAGRSRPQCRRQSVPAPSASVDRR